MNFWERFQKDLRKNLKESIDIFKEGSTAVSKKIEHLTEEGKRKYSIFSLNMKIQEEFAKLGGQIYRLIQKKTPSPLEDKKIRSLISRIQKIEKQVISLEKKYRRKSSIRSSKRTAPAGRKRSK